MEEVILKGINLIGYEILKKDCVFVKFNFFMKKSFEDVVIIYFVVV